MGFYDVFGVSTILAPFTEWDYRRVTFHEGRGLRTDMVLVSDHLVQWRWEPSLTAKTRRADIV